MEIILIYLYSFSLLIRQVLFDGQGTMNHNFNLSHQIMLRKPSTVHTHVFKIVLKDHFEFKNKVEDTKQNAIIQCHTQIDIIIAAFAQQNYIRLNLIDDPTFILLKQHSNSVPNDELVDIQDSSTSNENVRETSNEMKVVRNNIASLLWDARQQFICFQ